MPNHSSNQTSFSKTGIAQIGSDFSHLPAAASPTGLIFTPNGCNSKPRPNQGGWIFDRNYPEISAGVDKHSRLCSDEC